jgi:hypothetical protein
MPGQSRQREPRVIALAVAKPIIHPMTWAILATVGSYLLIHLF